jgi:hypothetical protein
VLATARPAGRYATLWHTGHPRASRLEIYHDEPGQDMSEWETELAFKLAD